MRNLLLFLTLFCSLTAWAQSNKATFTAHPAKMPVMQLGPSQEAPTLPEAPAGSGITHSTYSGNRGTNIVNPIQIGTSGNAFGFAFHRTTYLWADNNIKAATFIHRMGTPPGSGYLAYDLGTNGGLDWTNNVQAYDPTQPGGFNARYPQGAIYNPEGNTDPGNAFFHYFAPTLDGTNGPDWGGYAYGVKHLGNVINPVQHNMTSVAPYSLYLPSAFTITQTGEAWMVDANTQLTASASTYLGDLIRARGIWNPDANDFDYEFEMVPFDISPDDGINDIKIAFAPDGQTGWICILTNLPDVLPYTSYHPILFKTTDGGFNWDGPYEVQLGGEDGLDAVKNFITDEMLQAFYSPDPVPPRDEIDYFLGYECDMVVDAWGNPHISGTICIADNAAGSIWPSEGLMAMFHIWSDDQGQTWDAFKLGDLKRWDAEFANGASVIVQYNRPQVASTMDGAIIFFSWLDTENDDVLDNSQPDIFFREYLPTLGTHGEAIENVTFLSSGMWAAFFGCMSHYVFSEVTEGEMNYTCTIPFVYTQLQGSDPILPVNFFYIPDFVKQYTITGLDEKKPGAMAMVSQNFPNPFTTTTSIRVNLMKDADLVLEVYNLTGSRVKKLDFGRFNKGIHDLQLEAGGLTPGIYFYTVVSGNDRVTRKMVIQ